MKRIWSLDDVVRDPEQIVTVGTFDGVHIGHQAIVDYLVERARHLGGKSMLVTFDPHPRTIVHGEQVSLLTTPEERADACEARGLDRFVRIPFDRVMAGLAPESFVQQVLVDRVGMRDIVIGHDHGFGRGRSGDLELLELLGRRHGFTVDVVPAQEVDERVVSSSKIRRLLLEDGAVAAASDMLGRRYAFRGNVVPGAHRGRSIGYPTANLVLEDPRKAVPRSGVYAVLVSAASFDAPIPGMMNIGVRPTFDETERQLEVHLLDFSGDLYNQVLRVEFVDRLRSERRFDGVDALRQQLRQDEARCRALIGTVS